MCSQLSWKSISPKINLVYVRRYDRLLDMVLQMYSNSLLQKYIKEQIRYFPSSMKAIDSFISLSGIVFDNAIVKNEITMTDMPAVQFSVLAKSMVKEMVENRKKQLEKTIDAVMMELGNSVENCQIPSKDDLMNVTMENQLYWDPVECFTRGENQSEESFKEQLFAIQTCKHAIDSFTNITQQTVMTKSVIVRGHPGAGKTFCVLYMIIYALSKGLVGLPVAKMSHRSLQIGGSNWDKILCLRGNEDRSNIHRRAENAIERIKKNRLKEDMILSLHILFTDELGQLSAEDISLYDIILRNVRKSTVFMGGLLVIGTLDHLQIQPIVGRPFLTANCVIPCFKMVSLQHSVRATGSDYVELQSLVRKDYIEFETNPHLLQRFWETCSNIFTFVDNWDDERITPHTFRVFSKRVPVREPLEKFQHALYEKYKFSRHNLRERKSEDIEKSRYGHDWKNADNETTKMLNKKCQEPETLLFEKGLIYTCTFNDNKQSNTQKAILFDLPSQQSLDSFEPFKILLAPPGCKDVIYDSNATKESYLERGFVEISIKCAPHKIVSLSNNIQGVRKQYGIQQYIAGTIHSIMGDTLPSIATTFSNSNNKLSIWDKGQLLVIVSRTKLAKDTIFVGDKAETLEALESVLRNRTQWTDHMENILKMVTINQNGGFIENDEDTRGVVRFSTHPYRMNDIELPRDSSGYVYMLISIQTRDFFYIGKTKDLNEQLRSHQSGHGSQTSCPDHLHPYAFFAYICGFNGNNLMMLYVEQKWKHFVNEIRSQGLNDPRIWASSGSNKILNLNLSNFGINDTRSELRLVLMYQ